jgi:hypothetical protein
LAGSVVGVGGGSAHGVYDRDVSWKMTRGYIVLDKAHSLRPGYDKTGSGTWGQVMQHEVLHALGLGHAAGREEMMYTSITSTNHLFGAGDITGFDKIGAGNGCL